MSIFEYLANLFDVLLASLWAIRRHNERSLAGDQIREDTTKAKVEEKDGLKLLYNPSENSIEKAEANKAQKSQFSELSDSISKSSEEGGG